MSGVENIIIRRGVGAAPPPSEVGPTAAPPRQLRAPTADDLGFELLPADDEGMSPEADLAAAAESALGVQGDAPLSELPPEPLGSSWAFDFATGRFILRGGSPARVSGLDALRQWCMMALNAARFAHVVFSDEFGIEAPTDYLGATVGAEVIADYEQRIREALLVHDRIADVTSFSATWDPIEGVLSVSRFTVVTDEEIELPFADLQLRSI